MLTFYTKSTFIFSIKQHSQMPTWSWLSKWIQNQFLLREFNWDISDAVKWSDALLRVKICTVYFFGKLGFLLIDLDHRYAILIRLHQIYKMTWQISNRFWQCIQYQVQIHLRKEIENIIKHFLIGKNKLPFLVLCHKSKLSYVDLFAPPGPMV